MRRIAPFSACLFAGAALLASPPRSEATALPPAGLHQGTALGDSVHLARRGGFRGGGRAFAFRGGGRAFAFRGGGGRVWRGGRAWRAGPAYAWRGGRAWRGRPAHAWRGGRRVWRGGRWVWLGAGALAAPYAYGYSGCPVVRRRVWTPYGWRIRWVRRCYY